jgi:hypothetical protein
VNVYAERIETMFRFGPVTLCRPSVRAVVGEATLAARKMLATHNQTLVLT